MQWALGHEPYDAAVDDLDITEFGRHTVGEFFGGESQLFVLVGGAHAGIMSGRVVTGHCEVPARLPTAKALVPTGIQPSAAS
ncbi:hypothetical protein AB0M34_15875 [Nocardia sp. NPDC050193]